MQQLPQHNFHLLCKITPLLVELGCCTVPEPCVNVIPVVFSWGYAPDETEGCGLGFSITSTTVPLKNKKYIAAAIN
jgi:hypothetical protein